MRKIFILLFIFALPLFGQEFKLKLELSGEWLFKTGDDLRWANPEFDDSDWAKVKVPATFESQGYLNYDGFAWYRLHFDVPKELLDEKDVVLLLGRIDDADETFLNGVKIGETGKFSPEKKTEWMKLRAYPIPYGLLKQKNNVLAVRVCDFGFDGGIFKGPIGIILKKDFDYKVEENNKPHLSANALVSSNGFTAIVYNVNEHQITAMYEHIYKVISSGNQTKNIINSANFIVELNGIKYDLSKISEDEVGYINGTNIIYAKYRKMGVEVFYFTTFQIDEPVIVAICRVNKRYKQSKIYFRASTIYGEITDDISSDVLQIQQMQIKKIVKTKTVSRSDGTGGEIEKRVFIGIPRSKTKEESEKFSNLAENDNILNDEIKFWKDFLKIAKFRGKLTKDELKLFNQSIAVLKMAQCREQGRSFGQILASLPPGEWTYTWVRDGVYAINAMIELGYFNEAKSALEFMLKARAGFYKKFVYKDGKDYGVNLDYKITVCKYYGDGVEESDHNENGPNIELDGFGLFLWAFGNYVEKTGDIDFAVLYWDTVTTKIADVLISSIDRYGVIRAESGPWERHLPGKHYAYTTIAGIKGLRSIAKVAGLLKDKSAEKFYNSFADSMLKSFLKNFADENGVIKGTLEAKNESDFEYFDASVVEAINFGIILPNDRIAKNTIEAIKKNLKIKNRLGFFRVNNGDWYDRQEWIFINLRVAIALHKAGFKKDALEILKWVTSQSNLNFNLIAELYDEFNSDYQGQYPMVGFGAGAYILALLEIKK